MTGHRRALDLAAAALDWDLTAAESAEMDDHLATCSSCQRANAVQHGQATELRALTNAETPGRVRAEVLAATSKDAHRRRPTWTLLAAAALIAMAAVGAAVGAYLREQPTDVLPRPGLVDPQLPAVPSALTSEPQQLRWTRDPDAAASFDGELVVTVVDGASGFVAFGQAHANAAPLVWVSADGRTWDRVDQPANAFGGIQPTHVVAGGPGYVAIGQEPSDAVLAPRTVWTSQDGRVWARDLDPSGAFGKVDVLGVSSSGGVVLALVNDGPGERAILRSEDGTAWERSSPPSPFVTGLSHVNDEDGFVIIGLPDPRSPGRHVVAWYSEDGRSWTPTFESDGRLRRVVGTGTRLLAEGGGGSEGEFTLTSEDGRGWRPVPQEQMPGFDPAAPDDPLRATLAGGKGAFLAYVAPMAFDEPLVAWTSVDGETWILLERSPTDPTPAIPARPRTGEELRERRVIVSEVVPVAGGWVLFGSDRVTERVLVWSIR